MSYIDKFSKHNSSTASVNKENMSLKYSNRNSLGSKEGSTPRALICISNNVNNSKMIPAPVFMPKEELKYDHRHHNKYERGTYESDSSSAATIGIDLPILSFYRPK